MTKIQTWNKKKNPRMNAFISPAKECKIIMQTQDIDGWSKTMLISIVAFHNFYFSSFFQENQPKFLHEHFWECFWMVKRTHRKNQEKPLVGIIIKK